MAANGLNVVLDKVGDVIEAVALLASRQVMVGIPSTTAGEREGPINNAALGYIHENGAPEVGIPARPWLLPGVQGAQDEISDALRQAGSLAFDGRPEAVGRQLERVGMIGAAAAKNKINEGVPPPLARSTLQKRAARGRKGARQELANRAKGMPPSVALAKPLVDTGQMRNSVTYVVRDV